MLSGSGIMKSKAHASKPILEGIFKGFLIGAGALIPGLSGGTMALLTGVFEPLLKHSVGFYRHWSESFKFLAPLAIGGIASLIVLPKHLNNFSASYPLLSTIVFCSISFISLILFALKNVRFISKGKQLLLLLLGGSLSLLFSGIEYFSISLQSGTNPIFLLIIGLPLSFALVLPGISFSYMLLFFGVYEKFLAALSNFDIKFLFFLLIGTLFGYIMFTKILLMSLKHYKNETYTIILGFSFISFVFVLI